MATSSFTRKIEVKSKKAMKNYKEAQANAVRVVAKSNVGNKLKKGATLLQQSLSR